MTIRNLYGNTKCPQLFPPSEVGIPLGAIHQLLQQLEKNNIPMHAVLMMRHGKLIFEHYYAPYEKNMLHRMFSICKSLNALAIGLLEQEGKLQLDDKIMTYFPEKVPANVHPYIATMTIRDMLMMRTCHTSTTYKYDLDLDWVESFFTVPPTHQPGHIFRYDTSAAHVLCCLVERISGENMLDYLKKRVLREIGWSEESYVLLNQFNELQGGSGLMCTPMDLLLLGQLLLQHGMWNGKQLLPRDFVDIATSNLTPTYVTGPATGELPGYGYQIWYGEHDNFVLYGLGGQFVICMPQYDLVFVTCANTQGLPGANRVIFDALYDTILPMLNAPSVSFDTDAAANIALTRLNPHIKALSEIYPAIDARDSCQAEIANKTYKISKNPNGFDDFCIAFHEGNHIGTLRYRLNGTLCTLDFGLDKCILGQFPIYDHLYAASGCFISANCFLIKCHLLDTSVGHILIELSFKEEKIQIAMRKLEETMFNEYDCYLQGIQSK